MSRRERIIDGLEPSSNGLPVFEDEQEFQDYLEKMFEYNGFTAIQEVSPHRSRYKADLLLIHDDYGKIGLELKWQTGGTDASQAHQQIARQYAGKKYLGDRVDKWAYAPYMPKLQSELNRGNMQGFQRGKMEVLENFFHQYGIGTLNVHESPYCLIKYGQSRQYQIPAFAMRPGEVTADTNIEKIEARIQDRLFDSN